MSLHAGCMGVACGDAHMGRHHPSPFSGRAAQPPQTKASTMVTINMIMNDDNPPLNFAGKGLDFIVDVGPRVATQSTVVDMTGEAPEVLREGKGDASMFEW